MIKIMIGNARIELSSYEPFEVSRNRVNRKTHIQFWQTNKNGMIDDIIKVLVIIEKD